MSEEVRRLFRVKGRSSESQANLSEDPTPGSPSSHKRNIFQHCINYRRSTSPPTSPNLTNHHHQNVQPFAKSNHKELALSSSIDSCFQSKSIAMDPLPPKPKLPPRPSTVASSAPRTSVSSVFPTPASVIQVNTTSSSSITEQKELQQQFARPNSVPPLAHFSTSSLGNTDDRRFTNSSTTVSNTTSRATSSPLSSSVSVPSNRTPITTSISTSIANHYPSTSLSKPQPGDKQGTLTARSQGTVTTQYDRSAARVSPSGGTNLVVKDPSGSIHLSPSRSRSSLASLEQISPGVDTLEVCDKAAARLRELANHLEHGDIPNSVLQKTLQYAAYVLDTVSMDETRRSELNRQKPLRPRSNSHIEESDSTRMARTLATSLPSRTAIPTAVPVQSRSGPCSSHLSSASSSSSSPSISPLPASLSLSSHAATVTTSDCLSSSKPPHVDNNHSKAANTVTSTTTATITSTTNSSPLVNTVPKSKTDQVPLFTPRQPPNNNSVQKSDSVKKVILNQVDPKSGQIDEAESHQPQTKSSQDSLQRRLLDEEDELAEVQPDAVPNEVRAWLASTFTSTAVAKKPRSEDKPKFRSVANAIRAGIMVDRIYRRLFTTSSIQIPSEVSSYLKGVDQWSFDVFTLNEMCPGKVLRNLSAELLTRYGLVHKFKIPTSQLDSFLSQIELGYQHYSNPYHNNLHAADVTQTVHYSLWVTGLAQWLTDLEVLSTIVAAIIHDYKHTGTTNNFHIMSGSAISLLYNDRSVLENYHISEAFQVICKGESNIVVNLSKEEYREFRTLIIEMVIATDMSTHFQQVKNLKTLLSHSEFAVDKQKGLSYILHCADISHPSKVFNLHQKWTLLLMEEFFRQGDMEQELGLPYSPLCDRNSTLIPQSQIGFIDFIVFPTLELCGDLITRVHEHINLQQQLQMQTSVTDLDPEDQVQGRSQSSLENGASKPSSKQTNGSGPNTLNPPSRNASSAPTYSRCSAPVILFNKPDRPWLKLLEENKNMWQMKAAEEAKRMAMLAEQNKDDDAEEPVQENEN